MRDTSTVIVFLESLTLVYFIGIVFGSETKRDWWRFGPGFSSLERPRDQISLHVLWRRYRPNHRSYDSLRSAIVFLLHVMWEERRKPYQKRVPSWWTSREWPSHLGSEMGEIFVCGQIHGPRVSSFGRWFPSRRFQSSEFRIPLCTVWCTLQVPSTKNATPVVSNNNIDYSCRKFPPSRPMKVKLNVNTSLFHWYTDLLRNKAELATCLPWCKVPVWVLSG